MRLLLLLMRVMMAMILVRRRSTRATVRGDMTVFNQTLYHHPLRHRLRLRLLLRHRHRHHHDHHQCSHHSNHQVFNLFFKRPLLSSSSSATGSPVLPVSFTNLSAFICNLAFSRLFLRVFYFHDLVVFSKIICVLIDLD